MSDEKTNTEPVEVDVDGKKFNIDVDVDVDVNVSKQRAQQAETERAQKDVSPWDYETVDQLSARKSASWSAWCDRNGFTANEFEHFPTSRSYWSREHFKTALAMMPRDHPDRWKYVTGAHYAPAHYANRPGMELVWTLILFFPTFIALFVSAVCFSHDYWTLGTFFLMAVVVPWSLWLYFRHRALIR
jgi:hypothetical protein